MSCYPIIDKSGRVTGFMCGRKLEIEMCPTCGAGMADFACDFPIGESATCDQKLCLKCALEVQPDVHLCPEHAVFFKDNSDSFYLRSEMKKRHTVNTKNGD